MVNASQGSNFFKFESLDIWKNSVELAEEVYKISRNFPREEMYSLTDQLKRAVSSISLNIAESQGYESYKDLLRFLYHARGSLYEVYTCINLALSFQ